MDLYNLVATWTGWPIIVAALLLGGGYLFKLWNDRLDLQKERNQKLSEDLNNIKEKEASSMRRVTYGSVIRLIHEETGYILHSHTHNYQDEQSSKQQQVTAYKGFNTDDYWVVKGQHGFIETYQYGEPVSDRDVIRLEHKNTKMNLHSHYGHPSPVTGEKEVTAFGKDGIGDINDNWVVELKRGGVWLEGEIVRLTHKDTGSILHSHKGKNLPEYGFYQQEVACDERSGQNDWWKAAIIQEIKIA